MVYWLVVISPTLLPLSNPLHDRLSRKFGAYISFISLTATFFSSFCFLVVCSVFGAYEFSSLRSFVLVQSRIIEPFKEANRIANKRLFKIPLGVLEALAKMSQSDIRCKMGAVLQLVGVDLEVPAE